MRTARWQGPVLAAVGSVLGTVGYVLLARMVGRTGLLTTHLVTVVVVVSLINRCWHPGRSGSCAGPWRCGPPVVPRSVDGSDVMNLIPVRRTDQAMDGSPTEASSSRLRLSILAVVVISLFGALFARMWYLQVMVANRYQLQATANRIRTVQVEAPRGSSTTTRAALLVGNRTSLVVTIDPSAFAKLSTHAQDDLVSKVATELTTSGVPTKDAGIRTSLADKQYSLLQPIPIVVDVPDDVDLYFSERASQYPSVAVERGPCARTRTGRWPPTCSATSVASRDRDQGQAGWRSPDRKVAKPYQPDSEIGRPRVEAAYEDELWGTPGIEKIEVDAANNPVRVISETKPIPGDNLVLTLDIDAQASAESALASQLAQLQGGSESGTTDDEGTGLVRWWPSTRPTAGSRPWPPPDLRPVGLRQRHLQRGVPDPHRQREATTTR